MPANFSNTAVEQHKLSKHDFRPVEQQAGTFRTLAQLIENMDHYRPGEPLSALLIDTATPWSELKRVKDLVDLLVIDVGHFTDGRGFSIAANTKQSKFLSWRVRIQGNLFSDQVDAYFRCGADEVILNGTLLDRDCWQRSLESRPFYRRGFGVREDVDSASPQGRR